jgi:hypothetical protein
MMENKLYQEELILENIKNEEEKQVDMSNECRVNTSSDEDIKEDVVKKEDDGMCEEKKFDASLRKDRH